MRLIQLANSTPLPEQEQEKLEERPAKKQKKEKKSSGFLRSEFRMFLVDFGELGDIAVESAVSGRFQWYTTC